MWALFVGITSRCRYCRLSKARLISHEAICAAVKASLSTAKRLSERNSISMRHHIVPRGIIKHRDIDSTCFCYRNAYSIGLIVLEEREREKERKISNYKLGFMYVSSFMRVNKKGDDWCIEPSTKRLAPTSNPDQCSKLEYFSRQTIFEFLFFTL